MVIGVASATSAAAGSYETPATAGSHETPAAADFYGDSCEGLADLGLADVNQISAELVTTGSFKDPEGEGQDQEDLPEFCRVALTVEPQVNIEVWLPTDTYNGRFQAVGNGYMAGFIAYSSMSPALRAGYATASTDTGHPDTGTSGAFALAENGERNWQLIEDFASRSLFELTKKSQQLIEAFYGNEPEYSYWTGCSTGGRQGLMLAQRMPAAYDGILSEAPAINWDRFLVAEMWPQVVMHQDLGGPIPTCKLELATEAAVEYCDPLDGVVDGLLEDPRRCDFDPASLIGQETPCGVFTEGEAAAIQKIWDGPRAADGSFLWYGLEPGAPLGDDPAGVGETGGVWEPGEAGWDRLAGTNPFLVSEQYIKYFVLADPDWDYRTLTYEGFEQVFRQSQEMFNDVIGTDDPDLSAFRDSGGKVLSWHGWNDRMIFPMGSIDYFDRVQEELGGDVTDFARLFMAPGVDHCAGGPGPQPVDPFAELVDWVENGDAPEQLTAQRVENDQVVQTRPLCLYPAVAQYTGTGSIDEAANFECLTGPVD
ncbi:tannase/feruloyl esterase family alpha/beta hydrolase [Modestobacter lapidis]|nr:tannase/feruloyl esterase family alpha/beta hydrolase [Modestobacter lapidis]